MVKYINLGKADLKVSRICLGCMRFGNASAGQHSWTIGEEETREIIKYCLGKGINFFDTAIAYQNETSEQYVGKALCNFAKREDELPAKHEFTPFIGFVFVDEQYRGKRLSELMFKSATSYAHALGY